MKKIRKKGISNWFLEVIIAIIIIIIVIMLQKGWFEDIAEKIIDVVFDVPEHDPSVVAINQYKARQYLFESMGDIGADLRSMINSKNMDTCIAAIDSPKKEIFNNDFFIELEQIGPDIVITSFQRREDTATGNSKNLGTKLIQGETIIINDSRLCTLYGDAAVQKFYDEMVDIKTGKSSTLSGNYLQTTSKIVFNEYEELIVEINGKDKEAEIYPLPKFNKLLAIKKGTMLCIVPYDSNGWPGCAPDVNGFMDQDCVDSESDDIVMVIKSNNAPVCDGFKDQLLGSLQIGPTATI